MSQSQEGFRQLVDIMPLIVSISDGNGKIEFLNRPFADYTGLPCSGLEESWVAALHPEDLGHLNEAMDEGRRKGTAVRLMLRLQRFDGEYRWHQGQVVPVKDDFGKVVKWYGSAIDIHDQQVNAERSRMLAKQLKATLDSITDLFFTLDSEWRVNYANDEALSHFPQTPGGPVGKVLWEVMPELCGTEYETQYRKAMAERCAVNFEVHYPDLGEWLEASAYPSDEGLAIYLRNVSARKRIEEEVQFLAMYDPLTRLPNRRLLRERLQLALSNHLDSGRRGAVVFIDLDDFKSLNDTLGHDLGDQMLQQVAERLRDCVRADDTVARLGGDEFVVLLEQLSGDEREAAQQAERIGLKILRQLSTPYYLEQRKQVSTPSIGIAMLGHYNDSVEELMKRADLAMYQAKAGGRHTLRFFDPEMEAAISARVNLEAELRQALERGEFELAFQPQVDGNGLILGAEGLLRWRRADGSMVAPAEFIPVAEATGLIIPIGCYVLKAACAQLAAWQNSSDGADLTLSVNVSARQFRSEDFMESVLTEVERAGLRPHGLKLELTETLLLADVEDTFLKMSRLREQGIRFSLDDFGTGYSSLYYLKRLPFDELKIDKRFVAEVSGNPNDGAIVRAMIAMAHTLGLSVVAEGVETEAARLYLLEQGCERYQGYLFSKPLPLADFEALLNSGSILVSGSAALPAPHST